MTTDREAFLAGDRPNDVALFFADGGPSPPEALDGDGVATGEGTVFVVDGERGGEAFERVVGVGAMEFARTAMGTPGSVAADLTGGTCPDENGTGIDHGVAVVLAFSEEQNPDAGGIYADGDVIHAYARCTCGTAYSDRWVADEA